MRWRRGLAIALLPALALVAGAKAPPPPAPAKHFRFWISDFRFGAGGEWPWAVSVQSKIPKSEIENAVLAAGIAGHASAGVQFIGASSVTQHWNLPDERNRAKQAALSPGLDVLTLSPAWLMPDPAIEKFIVLALKHNPKVRVIVQQSWSAWDGLRPPIERNEQRDRVAIEDLRPALALMRSKIEAQVRAINEKIGRPVAFVAPVGDAVLRLREKVVAGQAPGIRKQSQLFRDPIGHGTEPVQRLASYVQFAVIYRRSPVGLKVPPSFLAGPGNEEWAALNRLLQDLAWEAVVAQPLSGVKAPAATE